MILTAFTIFHVILSLIAIAAGFVVVFGFLAGKTSPLTQLFLWTTIATSVTGFFFPFHGITPGIILGILSLLVLAIAIRARGRWRKTYVITSTIALYFNVFVLVVQLFEKVPALTALAPTQSEPPFKIAQGLVLLLFIILGTRGVMKYHPAGA
jgi:hypothetical protein